MWLRKMQLTVSILPALAIAAQAPGQAPAADSARARMAGHLRYFLSHPHGLNRLSPPDRQRIAALAAGFSKEDLPLVNAACRLPEESSAALDEATVQGHQRAHALLGLIGGKVARGALVADYRALRARLKSLRGAKGRTDEERAALARNARILEALRRGALDPLAGLGANELVADVLGEIESCAVPTQIVMLRYLGRAAVGNAGALERLQAMRANPGSSLHNYANIPLDAAIESLRTANARGRKDGGK